MTVTIVAPKAKELSKEELESIVAAEVIDEYGTLLTEHALAKEKLVPRSTKLSELTATIIGAVDEVVDPDTPVVLDGNEYKISLGTQGTRLVVADSEAVVDEIGAELFMKLAKVSITDLKAYCTPEQLELITKKTFGIKRRVKVEPL